jgi:hypothetical protein
MALLASSSSRLHGGGLKGRLRIQERYQEVIGELARIEGQNTGFRYVIDVRRRRAIGARVIGDDDTVVLGLPTRTTGMASLPAVADCR